MACWKDVAALLAIHLMCASVVISNLTADDESRSEEYLSLADAIDTALEEPDVERENEIRLKSVHSLESLLLEIYRIKGDEVCSAPITREVKLGKWRDETPDEDETRASRDLRKACHNAPKSSEEIPMPRERFVIERYPTSEEYSASGEVPEGSSRESTLGQLPRPHSTGIMPLRMSRIGPVDPPTTKKPVRKAAPPPDVDLKKMNEILKDRSAECKPRKVPVEIPKEPNMTLLPACALVERCGGCCKHESLQCVPVPANITQIIKTVVATELRGGLPKMIKVTLEKHDKCTCQCKVQASHCNSLQHYDKNNCRCVCKKNSLKPGGCKRPQYWDEGSCKCRCPQNTLTECSSGFFFSSEHCRCVSVSDIIRAENAKRVNRS